MAHVQRFRDVWRAELDGEGWEVRWLPKKEGLRREGLQGWKKIESGLERLG